MYVKYELRASTKKCVAKHKFDFSVQLRCYSLREVELVQTSQLPSNIAVKTQEAAWPGDSDLTELACLFN